MAAINKPFIFIGIAPAFYAVLVTGPETPYLLRHQTENPAITTASGNKNWLVMRTQFICAFVIVIRRSSGSFGRIEIKSSSEESQFIAFIARSLLPLNVRNELATQEELPTTTKRPSEFSFPVL